MFKSIFGQLIIILLFISCGSNKVEPTDNLSILSATINGTNLDGVIDNLQPPVEITIVFSTGLNLEKIKQELVLATDNGTVVSPGFSFANNQSKVVITAELEYSTTYSLTISTQPIGINNERLSDVYERSFTMAEDETIRSMPPCTSGDCIESKQLSNGGTANFDFYANYPIYADNAEWENLTQAIIVVHGQNRNADDYFNYLTYALNENNLSESTVLLAPWFKSESDAATGDFYWSSSNWREGQPSNNDVQLSSFAIVDSLISQLANKDKFPVMEKIIVTGHSSGGLFTHVYAASNKAESTYSNLSFDYVVANSQYFYYANNFRYNEGSATFSEPDNCVGFNFWPLGYNNVPGYLSGTTETTFNSQFVSRKITYLLGNGSASDPSLNTSDCSATLLGSSRYQRGENIFTFMNEYYNGMHVHQKVIVEGVSHDGEGMYKSPEFSGLLGDLLQE